MLLYTSIHTSRPSHRGEQEPDPRREPTSALSTKPYIMQHATLTLYRLWSIYASVPARFERGVRRTPLSTGICTCPESSGSSPNTHPSRICTRASCHSCCSLARTASPRSTHARGRGPSRIIMRNRIAAPRLTGTVSSGLRGCRQRR